MFEKCVTYQKRIEYSDSATELFEEDEAALRQKCRFIENQTMAHIYIKLCINTFQRDHQPQPQNNGSDIQTSDNHSNEKENGKSVGNDIGKGKKKTDKIVLLIPNEVDEDENSTLVVHVEVKKEDFLKKQEL
ncbi:hypothetical protein BN7_940 [Wickerhamomyces ciferrii]|uniref:Uncharacterized protein n=1 Tax=Wickerhamomyces ciferrii (strain ATCC 14091 / BCRC 22168 / CBS 111 / JCM 3599 / NBRC 0793 / NRRL Y-1031 F-60-10) TaxID=1206466 RepID=K0KIY0_WICCF|nr:uncharacterized protein BN7_940 [Wickerhamomyces ciferrii]CCH41399.1 hypothetical protein BN7_940 [Wickerhamomyces ciferrii]